MESCSECSGLEVSLAKSTEDRGSVDDDVVALEEPRAGLSEDVAGRQLAHTVVVVGGHRAAELGVEGREVVCVEEVEPVELRLGGRDGLCGRGRLEPVDTDGGLGLGCSWLDLLDLLVVDKRLDLLGAELLLLHRGRECPGLLLKLRSHGESLLRSQSLLEAELTGRDLGDLL